jgi:hypothetical protein
MTSKNVKGNNRKGKKEEDRKDRGYVYLFLLAPN